MLCVFFIEVFRGVPLITLLFMSKVLVPLAFPEDFPLPPLFRAAVVITLFSSAYMAENVRGGLQALHPGQAEAARALGLAGWQTTLLISLPQAIRNVIPAIVGQFIGLFKDTSLVYIIGMLDIVQVGRVFIQGNVEFRGSAREMFVSWPSFSGSSPTACPTSAARWKNTWAWAAANHLEALTETASTMSL